MIVSPEDGYNPTDVSSVAAESRPDADQRFPFLDRSSDSLLLLLGLGEHAGSNPDGTMALLFAVTLRGSVCF